MKPAKRTRRGIRNRRVRKRQRGHRRPATPGPCTPHARRKAPQTRCRAPRSRVHNRRLLAPVIGLLGGIGAGKSMVARQLARLGCAVVDADAIGHAVLDEPAVRRALVGRFGQGILDGRGWIDRRRLGRIAFADRSNLDALERVVHPRLWREVRRAVCQSRREGVPAVVLDAALILEKGLDKTCDYLVYISAPKHLRRARVRSARGWDHQEVARREASQISLKTKRHRADYIVDNRTSPEHTFEQIRAILSQIVND